MHEFSEEGNKSKQFPFVPTVAAHVVVFGKEVKYDLSTGVISIVSRSEIF